MRKPKTGNEQKTVKPKVRKLLTKHGWFWWATPATMYSQSGIADILAVKQGLFMAVETKFAKNDPTPKQVAYLNSIRAESHFAFIVRETTMDAFQAFLEALDASIEFSANKQIAPADVGGKMLDAIKIMGDSEVLNPARFKQLAEAQARKDDARKSGGGSRPYADDGASESD